MTEAFRNLNRKLTARPFVYLYSVFLLVQLVLYIKLGVFTGLEAEKYVTQGNLLYETGKLSDTKYIFYLPVILLVYVSKLLGVSFHLVVLVQVLLAGIALYYFYRLTSNLGNTTVAFYSGLLLCLFMPLQTWNFYLYSDSIFISLTLIYSYIVFTWGAKGLKGTFFILLFLALLVFSRPHGLLFIPPTIIFLLFRTQTRSSRVVTAALCLLLLAGMYYLLNTAFTGGEDMDAMKPFIEEHVICFVPLKPDGATLELINSGNPVKNLFYYILHNPLHFLKLMMLKLFSFFNLARPYYSTVHNIALLFFIIPVYFFGLIGLARFLRPFRNFTLFLVSLLILYPLGATFQCDDWHSRFTMVVFPYLIFLAVNGLNGIIIRSQKP